MRFNKLDLNLLVALEAMLSLQSVSRAAEQLHMSQSAMSSALTRLRDYFDDELLVQVGRRMEPTPRAEVLKEAVRDLLLRLETTITAQPEFDGTSAEREFRIFMSDFTMQMLAPHVLRLAQREAPAVRFHFPPLTNDPKRALERGELDLLVIPKPYTSPEHPIEPLFDEGYCCVVWSGSRLAQRGLTFEGYVGAGHVAMLPPGQLWQAFETRFMQRHEIDRRVEVTTYSFTAMPHLVIGTERVATVHERLARQLVPVLPITLLPAPMAIDRLPQTMQWHKYRTQDPGLTWLRDLMRRAVVEMDAVGQAQVPSKP
jgi:DNA-binding transcriptional LysR family regulator